MLALRVCQVESLATEVAWAKGLVDLFRSHRQLREILSRVQKAANNTGELWVITDVCTRWNYTYLMLDRLYTIHQFIEYTLQYVTEVMPSEFHKELKARCQQFRDSFLEHIRHIPAICKVLRACKNATDEMEGERGLLSQLLVNEDYLEDRLAVRM